MLLSETSEERSTLFEIDYFARINFHATVKNSSSRVFTFSQVIFPLSLK